MITRLTTKEELYRLWIELFYNKQGKITKLSDNSGIGGVAESNAFLAQMALKDIALVESHLFPKEAFDEGLDQVAQNLGIPERFGAIGSSTRIRVVADIGTQYTAGVHFFKGNGITFELTENVIVGGDGFAYAPVISQTTGSLTNVSALSINEVSPAPTGHKYCVNEYASTGGMDVEGDVTFRNRIMEGANVAAKSTVASIEQNFIRINSKVLKVYNLGPDNTGTPVIGVSTVNGSDLTNSEIEELLEEGISFFTLDDFNYQDYTGVIIKNIEYHPIDISFRAEYYNTSDIDLTRIELQTSFAKYFDPRTWNLGQKVEVAEIIRIIKSHPNIKSLPEINITPQNDIEIDENSLPRVRGFLMLDLNGGVLTNSSNNLNPVFYPNQPDKNFNEIF